MSVPDQVTVPPVLAEAGEPDRDVDLRWQLAVAEGRLRAVAADRDEWRRRCESVSRELEAKRDAMRRLRGSTSYRLGRALVTLAKNPARTPPQLLRKTAGRLRRIASDSSAAGAPAPERPRRRGARRRPPVCLYVAIGLAPDGLRALTRTVAQRVVVDADHVPVIVTDSPSFSLLRHLGVVMEYVPGRATWEQHRADVGWDELLAGRIAQLLADHDTDRTVIVDPAAPPDLARLLAP